MIFKDRRDAGERLAEALEVYSDKGVIIFALPRGGVVLGVEIARKLHAPLDLVLTKKIGHPLCPEYAIAAVAEEGEPIRNESEVAEVDPVWFQQEVDRIRTELSRRRKEYLGEKPPRDVNGRTVIIVDDGIATGLTMFAAITEMQKRGAKSVVVAIPVTPSDTARKLESMGVELVSLRIESYYLGAVGAYYADFRQVTDGEVISLLKAVDS